MTTANVLSTADEPVAASAGISNGMVFLLACACGLIAANLYYAQPLIGLISPDVGLSATASSTIVTLTQIGYCLGLLLLVPLGDLMENRRLILCTLAGTTLALLMTAAAPSTPWLLAASLLIGLGAVGAQVLIPFAVHLTPEAVRGRVVGNVMSGLLTGIMLARPTASLLADAFGWRAVFGLSAALMVALAIALRHLLPTRRPAADHGYLELIGSLWVVLRDTPLLRRRAAYQAAMFAAFSLYWTAVPLVLASPSFGLSQRGIAFFALAGAAGALAAPIAGRLADRGKTRIATGLSMALVAVSFLMAWAGSHSLAWLVVAGIALDLGVQANAVLGQRAIYGLGAHIRSRLNGLYIAIFFAGGAVGSSVASAVFTHGGWEWVCAVGVAFPLMAWAFYGTERR